LAETQQKGGHLLVLNQDVFILNMFGFNVDWNYVLCIYCSHTKRLIMQV